MIKKIVPSFKEDHFIKLKSLRNPIHVGLGGKNLSNSM